MLSGSVPFTCPECLREGWRDRITLTRHYAFAHHKLFEMTDLTPEMLNPCHVMNQDSMQGTPRKKREVEEDLASQYNQNEDHVNVKGGIKMGKKEDLELKASVAALSVKSDGNFVEWQKSFGKHDAQSGSRGGKKMKNESKEERKERKEKKRQERREAERREAKRCEAENVKSDGCTNADVSAKPLFSVMMQELDNSSSYLRTSMHSVQGEEIQRNVKEKSEDEYDDLPEPVYACRSECQCPFHF